MIINLFVYSWLLGNCGYNCVALICIDQQVIKKSPNNILIQFSLFDVQASILSSSISCLASSDISFSSLFGHPRTLVTKGSDEINSQFNKSRLVADRVIFRVLNSRYLISETRIQQVLVLKSKVCTFSSLYFLPLVPLLKIGQLEP